MDKQINQRIQQAAMQAKFYRFFSYAFLAVVGVAFGYIYYVKAEGSIIEMQKQIFLLPLILVPLIPAMITMSFAKKAEKKLHEELEKYREQKAAQEEQIEAMRVEAKARAMAKAKSSNE